MTFKYLIIFCLLILMSCTNKEAPQSGQMDDTAHGEKNHSYYTCSMHPQIHEHKTGSCPICGMPLIKVSGGGDVGDTKKVLLPSNYQKDVIGFTQGKVQSRDVVFELPTAGRLTNSNQVAFYVYESDILKVRVGQKFEGECSAMPGDILKGKITHIDSIADPSSRSVRVIGSITSTHTMKLIEGSFFGRILYESTEALMVPYEAVLRTGKENVIYVVEASGSLSPVKVTLGRIQGDEIEVLSGVSEGETISFGPNFLIDSEARLKGFK